METHPPRALSPSTVSRASLREQSLEILRSNIAAGLISEGALYSIGEIATQLGVSATPVREALNELAANGLVTIVRNRGFVVRPLTSADLDEIVQLRLWLEVPAIVDAAGRLSEQDVSLCRELLTESRAAAVSGDLQTFLATDRAFHLTLLGAAGNGRLVQIVNRLRDETRLYALRDLAVAGVLTQFADEHEELLDAIVRGERATVRALLTKHLRHTRGVWAGRSEPAS